MRWPRERRGPGGPRATPWITGALTAALTASAACTADSGSGDDTGLPGGEKPARAFAPVGKPQWTGRQLGMERVAQTELRGSTAIVLGADTYGRARLAVVDADSGKVRWSVKTGDRLDEDAILDRASGVEGSSLSLRQRLLVVGSGKQWSVLATYGIPTSKKDVNGEGKESRHASVPPRTERTGVAALSGRDGSVRWKTELDGTPHMLDTDGKTALVTGFDGLEAPTSYGIDAGSGDGRKLWSRPKQWVYRLAGGTALGQTTREVDHDSPGEGPPRSWNAVFGVDARSGKQKWHLRGEYEASTLKGAVEGSAVARVAGERGADEQAQGTRQVVLDTETGEEREELDLEESDSDSRPNRRVHHCETDRARPSGGGTLLACVTSSKQLLTIRAGEHDEPVVSQLSAPKKDTHSSLEVDTVSRGRVYLNGRFSLTSSGPPLAVDRTGDTLREPLHGRVIAEGPRHIATLTLEESDTLNAGGSLTIHRATEGTSPPSARTKRGS